MPTNLYGPGDPEVVIWGTGTPRRAELVAHVVGYAGRIGLDPSTPDGAPRELLDVSRLAALGWRPLISLEDGVREAYRWFRENESRLCGRAA